MNKLTMNYFLLRINCFKWNTAIEASETGSAIGQLFRNDSRFFGLSTSEWSCFTFCSTYQPGKSTTGMTGKSLLVELFKSSLIHLAFDHPPHAQYRLLWEAALIYRHQYETWFQALLHRFLNHRMKSKRIVWISVRAKSSLMHRPYISSALICY